jgi:hypothetical protein
MAKQFQHLSHLTALRQLSLNNSDISPGGMTAGDLSGIKHLSQLTSLQLEAWSTVSGLVITTTLTYSWDRLTALEQLALRGCTVQPAALACSTQLKAISLTHVKCSQGTTVEDLLASVGRLSLLTDLVLAAAQSCEACVRLPLPKAFTALTASSNLRCLQLCFDRSETCDDIILFLPGTMRQNLCAVDLRHQQNPPMRGEIYACAPGTAAAVEQLLPYYCQSGLQV